MRTCLEGEEINVKCKDKKKLDKLFADYIKKRDHNQCQWCGRTKGRMNCCHLIPRTVLSLRYAKHNALTLCFRCHMRWHENPLEAYQWLETKCGIEAINNLIQASRKSYVFNREEYELKLKELLT